MTDVLVFTSTHSGDADILTAPNVDHGQPRVLLIIKNKLLREALLDGEAASVLTLNASEGTRNDASHLGQLLLERCAQAEKLARL